MIKIQIKSLLFVSLTTFLLCMVLCTVPFPAKALPERYKIVSSEILPNFHFFEDQPWVSPPTKLFFNDFFDGKTVVILHLWATSCPSCISELKQLEKAATDYMNQPITFIALSLNDPRSGVLRNYFNRSNYTHLKPYHNASRTRPAIKGLPTTLFFNKSGELIGRVEGAAQWNGQEGQGDEMKRLLQRLMQEEVENTSTSTLKGFLDTWIARVKDLFS